LSVFVLAGHFSSFFGGLGDLGVYVPASLAALGVTLWVTRSVQKIEPALPLCTEPHLLFPAPQSARVRKYLWRFLIVALVVFFGCSIVLGLSVYPDNADSMIYRLPRAFWYASHGSFLHPFDSPDKRITFYPLDGVALYIPFILYNLPGTVHSFPSLIAWGLVFYGTYRFARSLGADRLIALLASSLVGFTPGILAQATSTNDEILTAVALLMSLYMVWRWLLSGRHLYFLLAATSFGIGVGTKLHIVFLAPVILAAFAVAVWQVRKKPELLKVWGRALGWKTAALSIFSVLVMFAPFLIYNYLSSGRFYFLNDFAGDVFNEKNGFRNALQNLLIYVSQMAISPIADLNSWPVANDRQRFNTILNEVFNPIIKPLLNLDPSFYHFTYRFVGVTIPTSVRFVEFSLWSGFVWMLWGWTGALSLRQKFPLRPIFFLIALTPPLWLLFWSASTLYMEGTATYFTYYLVCAAPAAAFAFAPIRKIIWHETRWVFVTFVLLTNMIICGNMLMFSGFRALPDIAYAKKWPYDWDLLDQPIIDELRLAQRARVIVTHEKMPYFAYMHWSPRTRYYSPYPMKDSDLPDAQDVLQLVPTPSDYEYGFMPLKIPDKATPGLTYLGTMRGIGREVIFATGNKVFSRHIEESNYIVPHITVKEAQGGYSIALDDKVPNLSDEDNLEFRFEIELAGQRIYERDWKRDPVFGVLVPYNPREYMYKLTLMVRSALSHKELTRATYQIAGPGAWLPDGSEY